MRQRADTITYKQVVFKLQHELGQNQQTYLTLRKKLLHGMQDNEGEEKLQMELEKHGEMVIYSLSVQIQTKMVYEYRYSVGDKNENMFRGYEYEQEDPNQVDQWNKLWCKYQFTFSDKKFIEGFNVFVRDSRNHSIQLMKISKDSICGYELVDLDNHPKNRQLCFISKQIRGQQEKIEEHQQIINITRIDNFSSNYLLITFREVDANAKTRIKAYSEIYEGYNSLIGIEFKQSQRIDELQSDLSKHKIQNQEIYEKQKQSMEQEFNNFKEYSQQIIQKYIDENERANEKIREYEYKKVNFKSEEINIQMVDTENMSQEDLTNLQILQEKLRVFKSKVDQMNEEEKFENQKQVKQKSRISQKTCELKQKTCELKKKSEESMLELQKCKEQLDKCLKSQEEAKYENEETLRTANKNQLKYQEKLKATYQQLRSQEEALQNQILRQREVDKKFEQMQAEHLQQKEEFEQKFNNLREIQSEQFQKQNEITVQQFTKIIENVNEVKQEQETMISNNKDKQSETNLNSTQDMEDLNYYQNNESIQSHQINESKFAFTLRLIFRLILIFLLYWFLYFVMPK